MTEREVITLKEYIDKQIEHISKLSESKIEAIEKATTLAKKTVDERLKNMNEFRDALKDQNSTFVPRTEYLAQIKLVEKNHNDRITTLEMNKERLAGKADQSAVTTVMIIACIGIALSAISILLSIIFR